jgi:hypothetical protein
MVREKMKPVGKGFGPTDSFRKLKTYGEIFHRDSHDRMPRDFLGSWACSFE